MKKILIFAFLGILCLIFAVEGFSAVKQSEFSEEVLRIHIRANSNGEADQKVKYKVRTAVVDYLTPLLVGVDGKQKAINTVEQNLDKISGIATAVLKHNGFDYSAKAKLRSEDFPTRRYEQLTLPAGVYDALVLELGSASGDNWWCVVYPPLCFVGGEATDGQKITYEWKLKEIIDDFFKKHKD